MSYQLTIVSPHGKIFDDQIEGLTAPGVAGELGILGGHIPIVNALKPGVLKITKEGQEKYYAIASGILEVNMEHQVLLLTNDAQSVSNREEGRERSANLEKS